MPEHRAGGGVRVSGVLIALNEEALIRRAIGSLKPWVSEIVVLDGGSTDKTREIAVELGASVFYREFDRNFGVQKSTAISLCTYPWVFLLDCDETIEKELGQSLEGLALNKDGVDIYGFSRKNTYSDKIEPEAGLSLHNWPDIQFRFFRNYVRYTGFIHESPINWRKAHHFDDKSIIHHKTWSRQKNEDDLYFSMRPEDYPERLLSEGNPNEKNHQSEGS